MRIYARIGYTLIEVVVALLVFTVGCLALAATGAVVARNLNANATRERAGRTAASRLEILGAGCRGAASGRETFEQIESEWLVALVDSARLSVTESVSYPTPGGRRTDLIRAVLPCPR